MAGVVFGLVGKRAKFYISAFCGLAGMLVTYILIPDISTLDLQEGVPLVMHCAWALWPWGCREVHLSAAGLILGGLTRACQGHTRNSSRRGRPATHKTVLGASCKLDIWIMKGWHVFDRRQAVAGGD